VSYSQLSRSERFELHQLRTTTDLSLRRIAEKMGRAQSTLSRELRRNQAVENLYLPDTAHQQMQTRRQRSKQPFMSVIESCVEQIKQRLEKYHSPEQISGRLKRERLKNISYETIYQMIYQDYQGLGKYQCYLRQGQTKRRRRKGVNSRQGQIPGRIGIEYRPEIADQKIEIGHWESDTMIGANHNGVLVTHVDKASKFMLVGLAKNKTVKEINRVTIQLFSEVKKKHRKTMTFDNGKEFSGHQKLAEKLELSCYFANPYHSWERGLNEHSNGLVRQFFPKGTNFKIVKPEQVKTAVDLINDRPRKSLDYRTPSEVFYAHPSGTDALQI
jgi:IS30 family transposase